MVRIPPPPPNRPIEPQFVSLAGGTRLVRIFNPIRLGPASYNHDGPRGRFDHHAPADPPKHDPLNGIYYAALTLADCIVEVFGDAGTIEPGGYDVALVEVPRPIRLLELRGAGAWDAGTVAAITKEADRSLSQEWARFIHTTPAYGSVDGISYGNAHNDRQAFALFERTGALTLIDRCALADPRLGGEIDEIALSLHLVVER